MICAFAQHLPVDVIIRCAARRHPGEELAHAGSMPELGLNKMDPDLPGGKKLGRSGVRLGELR